MSQLPALRDGSVTEADVSMYLGKLDGKLLDGSTNTAASPAKRGGGGTSVAPEVEMNGGSPTVAQRDSSESPPAEEPAPPSVLGGPTFKW